MPAEHVCHEDLPDYLTGRSSPEISERVEAHLAACAECARTANAWKDLIPTLREGGQGMFDAHPEAVELRAYVLEEDAASARRIAAHLEVCSACRLEVDAWRARSTQGETTREETANGRASGRRWAWGLLGTAAGLLAGILVTRVIAPAREESSGSEQVAETALGNPVFLFLLAGPVRGVVSPPRFHLPAGRSFVLLVLRPEIPEAAPADGLYHASVTREGGRTVWESSLRISDLRRSIDEAEIVTLAVPVRDVIPGTYELRLEPSFLRPAAAPIQLKFEVLP